MKVISPPQTHIDSSLVIVLLAICLVILVTAVLLRTTKRKVVVKSLEQQSELIENLAYFAINEAGYNSNASASDTSTTDTYNDFTPSTSTTDTYNDFTPSIYSSFMNGSDTSSDSCDSSFDGGDFDCGGD